MSRQRSAERLRVEHSSSASEQFSTVGAHQDDLGCSPTHHIQRTQASPGGPNVQAGLRTNCTEERGKGRDSVSRESNCCCSREAGACGGGGGMEFPRESIKRWISKCWAIMMDHLRLDTGTLEKTLLSLFLGCLSWVPFGWRKVETHSGKSVQKARIYWKEVEVSQQVTREGRKQRQMPGVSAARVRGPLTKVLLLKAQSKGLHVNFLGERKMRHF